MQTQLPDSFLKTSAGQEAESILRKCVHCGFCNATCPTYQLLGDEADGPRGRIYLIKEMLEGKDATRLTQIHLDRCLLCRACETTCPSGVNYSRLVDLSRESQKEIARPVIQRLKRYFIQALLPYPSRLRFLLELSTLVRLFIPDRIRRQLPAIQSALVWPEVAHQRKMIIHEGCVQSVVEPNINVSTAIVLDSVGISLIRTSPVNCCGALHYHLSSTEQARKLARENINQWWPHIEAGAEAIISNASGCGLMVKEYPILLKDDARYAAKAEKVANITLDIVQILEQEEVKPNLGSKNVIAYQSPCSMQHGQRLVGRVEQYLESLGLSVKTPENPHLCCGSAGSYSVLQPQISGELLKSKLANLECCEPDYILTSNIGCLLHMKTATRLPVMHWIEFVAENLKTLAN